MRVLKWWIQPRSRRRKARHCIRKELVGHIERPSITTVRRVDTIQEKSDTEDELLATQPQRAQKKLPPHVSITFESREYRITKILERKERAGRPVEKLDAGPITLQVPSPSKNRCDSSDRTTLLQNFAFPDQRPQHDISYPDQEIELTICASLRHSLLGLRSRSLFCVTSTLISLPSV